MRRSVAVVSVAVLAAVAASVWPAAAPAATGSSAGVPADLSTARPAGLDALQFLPNHGQWPDEVRFGVLGDTAGWLCDDGFVLRFERWQAGGEHAAPRESRGAVVRTRFVGARDGDWSTGQALLARHTFLRGDRARWQADVPAFDAVTRRALHAGIDVRYRALPADADRGPFEYDLLLAPGADLDAFAAEVEGARALRIDDDGSLVIVVPTPDGDRELRHGTPIAWQQGPAGDVPVRVAFRLLGEHRYGFVAEHLDPALAAVVDPGVVWGTFLGGGATDRIQAMQCIVGQAVWVAGWSGSTDFPTTVGAYRTTGGNDGFVAKLADDGDALLWATYLGGSSGEEIRGLALGPNGTTTVVGFTHSSDFPITAGALQSTYAGGSSFLDIGDGFVARLDQNGQNLLASTYLGGVFDDVAEDVAVDASGNAYVVGWSTSFDFPITAGVVQPVLGGIPLAQSDGFVCRIDATAQTLVASTFLGGQMSEQLTAVDRDPTTGDLLAVGWSQSADYPTTPNVVRQNSGGLADGVVTRLNQTLTTKVFSTYIGGLDDDAVLGCRFAANGSVWLGGYTRSVNYPATLNAPQTALAGASDGFVTNLTGNAQSIVFSTLLGGPDPDRVRDIDVSPVGVLVVGEAGAGFPVTPDAVQTTFAEGMSDAFLTLLGPGGSTLLWSSYFGGIGQDSLACADLDDGGLATVAGWTYSSEFPIAPVGYQDQMLGAEDGVVLRLDMISTLGEGLLVTPLLSPAAVMAGPGLVDQAMFDLENVTARALQVDSVKVLVTGVGLTAGVVSELRVVDVDDVVVGGPVQPAIGGEVTVPLNDLVLSPQSTRRLRLSVRLAMPANGSAEVAAAVVDRDAWTLHAPGAGGGPEVHVLGTGRVVGPCAVLGALPGDVDADQRLTVVDVRRLLHDVGVGALDVAHDADGDGVITPADVAATRDAVLGRGTPFFVPAQVGRGEWLTMRCLLPRIDGVQASLGGRSVVLGRATPRSFGLRVPLDLPFGQQELVVTLAGRVVFSGFVQVL